MDIDNVVGFIALAIIVAVFGQREYDNYRRDRLLADPDQATRTRRAFCREVRKLLRLSR